MRSDSSHMPLQLRTEFQTLPPQPTIQISPSKILPQLLHTISVTMMISTSLRSYSQATTSHPVSHKNLPCHFKRRVLPRRRLNPNSTKEIQKEFNNLKFLNRAMTMSPRMKIFLGSAIKGQRKQRRKIGANL